MNPVAILVCGAGLLSGALAGWLWKFSSIFFGKDDFWPRLQRVMKMLVSDDSQDDFFKEYIRLIPIFCTYLLKKLAVTVIVLSPIVVCYLLLRPSVNDWEISFIVAVSLGSIASLLWSLMARH